jgi:large subunit ribosomal protein L14e
MFDVGRICLKTAGRDAGRFCMVIEKLELPYVIVEGYTRRKKVNIRHLEPTDKVVEITKDASREKVIIALEKEGYKVTQKKGPKYQKAEGKESDKPKEKPAKRVKKGSGSIKEESKTKPKTTKTQKGTKK